MIRRVHPRRAHTPAFRRIGAGVWAVALLAGVGAAAGPAPDPEASRWDPGQTLDLRNPFLPPGYTPPAPDAAPEPAAEPETPAPRAPNLEEWRAAEAALDQRGVVRGGRSQPLALIEGQGRAVGDVVEMRRGAYRYRWRVAAIDLRFGPRLERLGAVPADDPEGDLLPLPEDEP